MENFNVYFVAILFFTCVALSASPMSAETLACDDVLIEVEAQEDDLAVATCAVVARAKVLLGSCELTQRSPIRISIVESAIHPSFGECMAIFDPDSSCIQITNPNRYSELLSEDDARFHLPPDVIFAAVIVHEMAHALVYQSAGELTVGTAEQEFIAHAFEMESIDPEWRDTLLEADPVNPSGSVDLVHPAIYALAPRAFANNAWRVFRREGNGCALVQKIISGAYMFPRY